MTSNIISMLLKYDISRELCIFLVDKGFPTHDLIWVLSTCEFSRAGIIAAIKVEKNGIQQLQVMY